MAEQSPLACGQLENRVWHHLTPHKPGGTADVPLIVRGDGMRVWDTNGNEYLDAVSGGVWTVNVGYGRSAIADAVREQLLTMNYFAMSAANEPALAFAEKLLEKMPGLSRVYYSNSGSEANEKAFKMVRQISARHYGGRKSKILYRERDYHGTTIACLSATGQYERKHQYGPFVPDFVEVPHCCEYRSQWGTVDDYGLRAANEIERVILAEGADTVGALCLEPVTAGGGVIPPPEGYYQRVQEICRRYDILLLIDEVVCGLGRTGTWFGYQSYGIEPDIVTMAKGVASGYAAVSCTVTNDKVFDLLNSGDDQRLDYFRDISTFAGCTAGPTAALVNMDIIEREGLLQNTLEQGTYLLQHLRALQARYPLIGDVRGKGLFVGLELVVDRDSKAPVDESVVAAIVAHCKNHSGVLIGRTNRSFRQFNNTVCLAPALIASRADIDVIVGALDKAFSAVSEQG